MLKFEKKPRVGSASEFRTYHGRVAVGALSPALSNASFEPASMFAVDPEYLAAGHEGDAPQAIVAYRACFPAAYMPFVVRPSTLPVRVSPRRSIMLPYQQLRVLGYQASQDSPPSLAEDLLHLILNGSEAYDLGIASEIPTESPLARAFLSYKKDVRRAPRVATQVFDSFRIRIAASLDEYLQLWFSAKARNDIRRKVRRFRAEFPETTARAFTAENVVEDFLRDAEAVSMQSYQWSRGLPVVVANLTAANRLRYLATRGVWRSYVLYAGGQPCAYCQGLLHEGVFDYDVVAYDSRYAGHSPGTVLLLSIIEDLSSTRIAHELDFGAGPGAYKHHFATHRKQVMYASIYPRRPYTWLLKGAQSTSKAVVAAAKRVLRRDKAPQSAKQQSLQRNCGSESVEAAEC